MAAALPELPPRFVVGTGRCGSTLLSRMLAENPRVLNLFEFLSGIDEFFRFRRDPVPGAELAARLRQDHPMLTMVLRRGHEVPEVVYPFGAPGARFARGDAVPWILAIAIPRVSREPDALFEALLREVEGLPAQPLSAHYRHVFAWLVARCGRELWIERSGSSIGTLGTLAEFFPGARFVHIHRDGREAAISMREYTVLRVAVAVMNGMLGEVEYSHEGLEELERRQPEAIDRLIATRPPIELFGRYWSGQVEEGYAALRKLDPASFVEVAFEALLAEPRRELARIADFFELDGGEWIARAARLVDRAPPARFAELPADERARLDAACRPGMQLLGRT
jgi:putative sulfotransferase